MPSKHNNGFLRALFQATDYGILMTDLTGTDLLCNQRFNELFGIDSEAVGVLPREEMRRLALDRVKDPLEFAEVIDRVYRDPNLEQEDEIQVVRPVPRILRRHTAPVLREDGELVGRIWTFLDVTETRRLQAEVENHASRLEERLAQQAAELHSAQQILLATTQMRAVGALATGIAHDLRNILTSLRLGTAASHLPETSDFLAQQLDRLYALTHSLLALSNEAPTESGPVDVTEVIRFVFQLVRGQAEIDNVVLTQSPAADAPPAYGNPRRLEHLFINLVLNGLNAMAAEGGELVVAVNREGNRLRVDVFDTGPGIPEECLSQVFEPFFTTRSNRTGLGLFSAKRIVEAHSGEISVTNRMEHGARVSVWLPCAAYNEEHGDRHDSIVARREADILQIGGL